MRCKPPCMAWVNRCEHPENLNRIVSVHPESIVRERGIMWKVTAQEPMKGIDLSTGKRRPDNERFEFLWCYDADLTPINDPGIDTSEKDVPATKTEQWEFPKEKENV